MEVFKRFSFDFAGTRRENPNATSATACIRPWQSQNSVPGSVASDAIILVAGKNSKLLPRGRWQKRLLDSPKTLAVSDSDFRRTRHLHLSTERLPKQLRFKNYVKRKHPVENGRRVIFARLRNLYGEFSFASASNRRSFSFAASFRRISASDGQIEAVPSGSR